MNMIATVVTYINITYYPATGTMKLRKNLITTVDNLQRLEPVTFKYKSILLPLKYPASQLGNNSRIIP
jgi:hypothetical protein